MAAAIPWVVEEPDAGPVAGAAGNRAIFPSGVIVIKWPGMVNGDVGVSFPAADFPDKTVEVSGTPGAGFAATIQGSDTPTVAEPPDAEFFTLRDAAGSAVAFTGTPAGVVLLENTYRIRPKITGGDGSTAVTFRVALNKPVRR